jgi:hypothetical protein
MTLTKSYDHIFDVLMNTRQHTQKSWLHAEQATSTLRVLGSRWAIEGWE